ncbi:sugar phosphate isomerase/epimerase family protein [Labrys wisconsinensis]|uniref:Sugar phosphate isomerase/epimerase n=1 Tax=Labrys wisconsinensis TaxID=425677 RepID=A0ABU0JMM5_9HYPH|nr:sugar phosphate isomerase/epimerase [Labrys wisconsinensis]MDQ0474751.1 sugar phosphate isomerase/epimerase [Labrys wisconsinensis]
MAYKIAFQLYSARNFPPLERQLEGLAQIGYDGVEPWLPAYAASAADFRRKIDAAGLACYGFHLPFKDLVAEPQRFIDIAGTIGARLLIPPYLMPEDRPATAEGWRAIGRDLQRVRDIVAGEGLKLAWHNHDFEYHALPDGSRPIDLLFEGAGADVGYEIDFAWVLRGGGDPLAELKRYGERMLAIQVKDTAPLGTRQEGGWTAMGDGIVDWAALWPLFKETPADHLVVEHDEPADWRQLAQRSYDYLVKLGARG